MDNKAFSLISIILALIIIGGFIFFLGKTDKTTSEYLNKPIDQAKATQCLMQRKSIEQALLQYNLEHFEEPTLDDIKSYFAGNTLPLCPEGGKYNIEKKDGKYIVKCSVHKD